jgi:hypothetical protein
MDELIMELRFEINVTVTKEGLLLTPARLAEIIKQRADYLLDPAIRIDSVIPVGYEVSKKGQK